MNKEMKGVVPSLKKMHGPLGKGSIERNNFNVS
jgi:hypothetical protein